MRAAPRSRPWAPGRRGLISAASAAGPSLPRTCSATVRQAREAFRRFRDSKASGKATNPIASEPYRVIIELPLPVKPSLLNNYTGEHAGRA